MPKPPALAFVLFKYDIYPPLGVDLPIYNPTLLSDAAPIQHYQPDSLFRTYQ